MRMQAVGIIGVIPLVVAGMLGMATSSAMRHMQGVDEDHGFVLSNPFSQSVAPVTQCMQQLDLVLLVDRSGSIKPEDWAKMIPFLKDIVLSLSLDKNDVRLALVTYGSSISQHIGFLDPASRNEALALEVLSGMEDAKQTGEHTYTGEALNFVEDDVFRYGRKHVPNVVIVITDGISTNYWSTGEQSSLMRLRGFTIMVVGVGEANVHECRGIVGCSKDSPCHLFVYTNWDQMKGLVSKFMTEICLTVAKDAVCEPVWEEWSECSSPCGVKGIRTRPLRQLKTLAEPTTGSNGKIGRSCLEQIAEYQPPEESCMVECIKPEVENGLGIGDDGGVANVINLDDKTNAMGKSVDKDNGMGDGISPGGVATGGATDSMSKEEDDLVDGDDFVSEDDVSVMQERGMDSIDNLDIATSDAEQEDAPTPKVPGDVPVVSEGVDEEIKGDDPPNLISPGGVVVGKDNGNVTSGGAAEDDKGSDDESIQDRVEEEERKIIEDILETKHKIQDHLLPGDESVVSSVVDEDIKRDDENAPVQDGTVGGSVNATGTGKDNDVDAEEKVKGNGDAAAAEEELDVDENGDDDKRQGIPEENANAEDSIDTVEPKDKDQGLGDSVDETIEPSDSVTGKDLGKSDDASVDKVKSESGITQPRDDEKLEEPLIVTGSGTGGNVDVAVDADAKETSVVLNPVDKDRTSGHSTLVGIPDDTDGATRNEVIRRHEPGILDGGEDAVSTGTAIGKPSLGGAGVGTTGAKGKAVVVSPGKLGGRKGTESAFDDDDDDEDGDDDDGSGFYKGEGSRREGYGAKIAGGVAIAALFMGAAGGYVMYKRRRQVDSFAPDLDVDFDPIASGEYKSEHDENFTVSELDNGLWAEAN